MREQKMPAIIDNASYYPRTGHGKPISPQIVAIPHDIPSSLLDAAEFYMRYVLRGTKYNIKRSKNTSGNVYYLYCSIAAAREIEGYARGLYRGFAEMKNLAKR